jgi:dTDP-4-amino-4,6-dideoxygalactose transaminase
MYERYHHDVVGVNSRLDSIQAAVLNAKLPLLDQYGRARQDASRKYSAAFEGHNKLSICDCHVFHQYTLRIVDGDRDGLMKYLQQRYSMCYLLSIPLHTKAYLDARYKEEDFSNKPIGERGNFSCIQVR